MPCTIALLGCGAARARPHDAPGAPPVGVVVPLDVAHTAAAGRTLLLAGADRDGRACVYAADVEAGRARALRCEAGWRVAGLAGVDGAALVVLCPPGVPGTCRLDELPLAPDGAAARTLHEGALDGPLVVHDGVVDAARGEAMVRLRREPGAPPETLDDVIYAGGEGVFWHRGRVFGRSATRLVVRDARGVRRPVEAIRWVAFAADGERLWGIDRRVDGTITLESWAEPERSVTTVAEVPGGEAYRVAVARDVALVASGRILTPVRREGGRAGPGVTLPGDGAVHLQAAGSEVYVVTQGTTCDRVGRLGGLREASSRHRGECSPDARALPWSSLRR